MARVQIFDGMPPQQKWSEFMDPRDPALITVETDSAFTFEYTAGEFANWRITAKGSGFTYVADENGFLVPTGGKITAINVFDETGALVLRLDQFAVGQKMDLADYYYTLFNTGSEADSLNGFDLFTQLLKKGDLIVGSSGGDDIASGFNRGNDTIMAGLGDDFVKGDAGSDSIDGGGGSDTLSYQLSFLDDTAFRGIKLNAVTGIVLDSWGGQDTIAGFESFRGSKFADSIIGSNVDFERFYGLRGADTLDGGGGTRDEAVYERDARFGGSLGIVCDLQVTTVNGHIQGTIRDGFGHVDQVIDIERVRGTMKNDVMVGSSAANVFTGLGGTDSFDGKGGIDGLSFSLNDDFGATQGVKIDLRRANDQIRNDGFGHAEDALSIENLFGSSLADNLTGNAAANIIKGEQGADTMAGGGSADTFEWSGTTSFGDTITDFVSGIDKLSIDSNSIPGMGNTINFNNGPAPNGPGSWFFFKPGDSTLYWDRDGTGAAFDAVAIVTLQGLNAMSGTDIIL